ncbi:hypothetical protein [Myxosarcina sp. GI1]|uniref:hypothetical protein n=1 Tax=Myxosarcina sp. GI1 TaxID=1541065 RepID=UPI000566331E|nr:hypothetical protein [Myxosarcina sp. GI1]
MDSLQIQISELKDKIDCLYEIIARLDERIYKLDRDKQSTVENSSYSLSDLTKTSARSAMPQNDSKYQLTHKDVLIDDNTSTSKINAQSDRGLSSDIQIRRLTAQLTAAYNRIAALEEQILTYRVHS